MTATVRVNAWEYGVAPKVTYYVDLVTQDCCTCGVVFALDKRLDDQRREDHQFFYCPNGHSQHYTGKSETEKLREELALEKKRTEWARTARNAAVDQANAAERSARSYKGHLTRLRNRIANGVCPVQGCQRSFANVHGHILNKHPDWAEQHPEVMS